MVGRRLALLFYRIAHRKRSSHPGARSTHALYARAPRTIRCDLVPTRVTAAWLKHLSKEAPTLAFHASITNPFGKVRRPNWHHRRHAPVVTVVTVVTAQSTTSTSSCTLGGGARACVRRATYWTARRTFYAPHRAGTALVDVFRETRRAR